MSLLPATFAPDVTNRAFIDDAADMGFAAREAGALPDANPFIEDSPVFDAWAYGYALACSWGRVVIGGFVTSGNIAPIGRAYRAGTLDSFQVAALLDWMSPARFAKFIARWRPETIS